MHTSARGRRTAFRTTLALLLFATAPALASAQNNLLNRSVPPATYFIAQANLYAGELRDAEKMMQREARGAIKTTQSSWIDSICYRAMLGEIYYHQGNNAQALEQYNAALNMFVAFSDWMIRVQFPPSIGPDQALVRKQIPWGRSQRRFKLGRVANSYPIRQGKLDQADVLQQGGVVQQAVLMPINVQEIVRCTALAIRRRRELMGPVCKHDPLSQQVLAKLTRRPGPPNHWSQAWIDLQLGLAYAATDQTAQAMQFLQRSMIAGGEFDHPLTCVALVELGKLALQSGDFDAAARAFEEASYSAVYYENAAVLIEAMRLGQRVHLMSNQPGVYPALARAKRWAQVKDLFLMQAWLGVLEGENYAALGQSQQAAAALVDASGVIGRRDMGAGMVGAYLNFNSALVQFQRNRSKEGSAALAKAMAFQNKSSHWGFQITLADRLYTSGAITPRIAVELYHELLRDPAPRDWTSNPIEALSVLVVPHGSAYENWFDSAVKRKEIEMAVEIADLARRHRFYSTLPLGGRLLSLRQILESSPDDLNQKAAVQRQDLLVRFADYATLSQQAATASQRLARLPLLPKDGPQADEQTRLLGELARASEAREAMLMEIALRREPADMIFPPALKFKEIQAGLQPGQAALVFFDTSRGIYAFLLNQDQYAYWLLSRREVIERHVVALLRELGNFDSNRELTLGELTGDKWRQAAADTLGQLLASSKVDLSQGIEELVIVPDGVLWYLPFEALPTKIVPGAPLLTQMRVRYAPTLSLAVPSGRPRKATPRTGVVVGKLSPQEKEGVTAEFLPSLLRSVPDAVALPKVPPATTNIYSSTIDQLIVLDDLAVAPEQPYGWTPIPTDRSATAPLSAWFALPGGGPDVVILPGFHTLAESSLKRSGPAATGQEVFLSLCGLMSTGARTVLLSRWRMGGQTALELTRDFAQELPHVRAADAWQRSVELARERPISSEVEPRIRRFDQEAPAAAHPMFWAGYMLVDTGIAPPNQTDQPVAEAADENDAARPPAIRVRRPNAP